VTTYFNQGAFPALRLSIENFLFVPAFKVQQRIKGLKGDFTWPISYSNEFKNSSLLITLPILGKIKVSA